MAAHTITQEPRQHRSQTTPTPTDKTGKDLEKGSSDNRLGGGNSQRPSSWKTFGSPAQLHFKSEETVKKFFRQTILPNHIFKLLFLPNNVPTFLRLRPYFFITNSTSFYVLFRQINIILLFKILKSIILTRLQYLQGWSVLGIQSTSLFQFSFKHIVCPLPLPYNPQL